MGAGFGTYRPNQQYKSRDAKGNANAMAAMLRIQGEQLAGVGEAVEGYGQSRARSRVANLLGSEEYQNEMDPVKAQALRMAATGGRNLGEEGVKVLDRSGDNKTDLWKNEEDIKASTVLFGRQQARDAASEAGANARQSRGFAHSKAMQKLRGNATSALLGKNKTTSGALRSLNREIQGLTTSLNDPNISENARQLIKEEISDKRLQGEALVETGGYSAGAGKGIMDTLLTGTGQKTSSTGTKKYPKLPKSIAYAGELLNHTDNQRLKQAYEDNIITALPAEYYGKNDPEVESGAKRVGDKKFTNDVLVKYKGETIRKNISQAMKFVP